MKIAILAHNLRVAGGLSVGCNIIAALRRVADHHEYFLTIPDTAAYDSIELPTRARVFRYRRRAGTAWQLAFDLFVLSRLVRRQRPDLVLGLGNYGLRNPGCRQALLCHDAHLVYERSPRGGPAWDRDWYTRYGVWRLRRCLAQTQLVFCQTGIMLERFRRKYAYRGDMALLPNTLSQISATGPAPRPAVFERLGGRFVLFALGYYYTHKNLETLVDLFKARGADLPDVVVLLTIDPRQKGAARRFLARTESPDMRAHFVNAGPAPQAELAGYYRNCNALILPTVLESSCGAYLEAMHFETPILTSDLDFARAACGDAALYFDPYDADAICAAIQRLRSDPDLRSDLRRRGTTRLQSHVRSWDEIVHGTMKRLESLVG